MPNSSSDMTSLDLIEHDVAKIWSEVLQLAEVTSDDGFASLGGESLSATRVLTQIKERFGVDLSVTLFFEASTVKNVALLILRSLGAAHADASGGTLPLNEEGLI